MKPSQLLKSAFSLLATLIILALAIWLGRSLWVNYMDKPWTRDGRVRAEIVNVAADVSGAVVSCRSAVRAALRLREPHPSHVRLPAARARGCFPQAA